MRGLDRLRAVLAAKIEQHPRDTLMARRFLLAVSSALLLAGCAAPARFAIPPAQVAGQPSTRPAGAVEEDAAQHLKAEAERPGMVRLAAAPRTVGVPPNQDLSTHFPTDNALTVATEALALKDFLHYVFGELLKASYVVAEGIPGLDQLVTLNVQAPISSRALFKLVSELLAERKIGITYRDGVYFIVPVDGKSKGNVPIGVGREPQDVPDAAGRILQIIPLRYGTNISIERTAHDLVDVQVFADPAQSALFVSGERAQILKVLDVVRLLDQPATRASAVAVINLTYVGTKEFTDQVVTLLENEGIPTAVGRAESKNVALVPLEQLGALIVFASGSKLLERVEFWAQQIDRPSQGPSQQYFIYHPKYARASDLGASLAPLIGGPDAMARGNLSRDTRSALGPQQRDASGASSSASAGGASAAQATPMRRDSGTGAGPSEQPVAIRGDGVTMSVDPRSNSLIFYTAGLRYQSLLPMVRRLDVAPKQILLEATIAEVTLTGEFAHGVEFAFTSGKVSGSTLGGLGLPSGGLALNYIANVTDSIRVKLLSTDSLVNILSNPILVVRDGVQASISVGNDVPTLGATTSSPTTSSLTVTSVLYRRTGLTLNIRPTINAEGLVVMEIDQTISDTVAGNSGVNGAPTFFDRAVTTEVVAKSGQTVLLAGLISENNTDSSTSVPGLGKIPGLGWLFSSASRQKSKTELVLLITPRVIDTPDEWDAIRGGLERALDYLQLPPPAAAAAKQSGDQPLP
jgi:general secretion pathway protein D